MPPPRVGSTGRAALSSPRSRCRSQLRYLAAAASPPRPGEQRQPRAAAAGRGEASRGCHRPQPLTGGFSPNPPRPLRGSPRRGSPSRGHPPGTAPPTAHSPPPRAASPCCRSCWSYQGSSSRISNSSTRLPASIAPPSPFHRRGPGQPLPLPSAAASGHGRAPPIPRRASPPSGRAARSRRRRQQRGRRRPPAPRRPAIQTRHPQLRGGEPMGSRPPGGWKGARANHRADPRRGANGREGKVGPG